MPPMMSTNVIPTAMITASGIWLAMVRKVAPE
jgi:hypothetical protein